MEHGSLGAYMKERRQALGLTQTEVCEGICETMTLSRLESGSQTPAYNRIVAMLQRLGLPDDRFIALLNKNELETDMLKNEIIACNIQFEEQVGQARQLAFEKGMEKLAELEAILEKDDQITRQFILRSKVILGKPEGGYSLDEQREMLLEAIRLTVPRFDLEEIDRSLYSLDEIKIIIQIANVYSLLGQHRKAVDILSQLLKYIQKHCSNLTQSASHLPFAAHNYALELALCGRYEEAIEIARLGWNSCVKFAHYQHFPGLIHIMAECYHFLGNDEKALRLFYQAYYIYEAIDNTVNLEQLKASLHEYYDLDFDPIGPHQVQ